MVLLDGLVEGGLAKQQESQANPHGQQPGHGKAESAVGHITGSHTTRIYSLSDKKNKLY